MILKEPSRLTIRMRSYSLTVNWYFVPLTSEPKKPVSGS